MHVTIVEPLGIDLLNSTAAATFKPDDAPTKNPSSFKSLKTYWIKIRGKKGFFFNSNVFTIFTES